MKKLVLLLLFGISTSAGAEEIGYVPFLMDQQTYQNMMTYLGEVPSKYANPIINTLNQKEQMAVKAEVAKREATKAEDKPKE